MADEFIFDSDDLVIFCSEFDKYVIEELDETFLQVTLQDLNDRWASVQRSYRALCIAKDLRTNSELIEAARKKYYECTKALHKCKAKILDAQKLFAAEAPTQNLPAHDNAFAHLAVPPCDTDIFYGGYEEWPSFRDMFTAVYIDNPGIPAVQKLYHLRLKVQGQAGAIIKKYKLCADNFSLAWEALKDRYENQRILVENQIKILLSLSTITEESSVALQNLQGTINDCLAAIKSQNVPIEQWDPFIIMLCASKLPTDTLSLWEQSLESHKNLVKWEKMDRFLSHRCEVVERLESRNKDSRGNNKKKEFNKRPSGNRNDSEQYNCKVCHSNHPLKICPQFLRFDPQTRSKFVTDNNMCLNCLANSHVRKDCPSKFTCSHCRKNHHSLLHFFRPTVQSQNSLDDQQPETSARARARMSANAHVALVQKDNLVENTLLPTAIVQINHRGENFKARAFLDQGSEKTFISRRLQQKLMLPTESRAFQIHGIGGQLVGHSNSICKLTLFSRITNHYIDIQAIVVTKISQMLPSVSLANSNIPFERLRGMDLADPDFYLSNHVDMLIGSNVLPHIFLSGIKKLSPSLMAQLTIFGWVISGPVNINSVSVFSIGVMEVDNDALTKQLKRFWEQEEVTPQRPVSQEDAFCEKLYKETTYRNNKGRYVVKLPFKSQFPKELYLGTSRSAAKAQYLSMERSLTKNPDIENTYKEVLREYITLGHMEPTVSSENVSVNGCSSYYLPHHAVIKPESKSTKVRVVFNASKKTSCGLSLNDVLHVGPTLQADLMSIILKWRLYKHGFCGDIEKMYRQILVHKDDTPYQRILFRENANDILHDYALKTVTFGVNCAPYLAIRTLIQLAHDSKEIYPEASRILTEETYVDDILSGAHDKQTAINSLAQVIAVLKSAGFPLKKITSNCSEVLKSVPQNYILDTDFLKFKETSTTKTLGIQWNALSDEFSYIIEPLPQTDKITKRKILSMVAKLFDPAGWISPIIIQAKFILQQLWLDGTGWDDPVKPQTLVEWKTFIENLSFISQIKIPRWIGFSPSQTIQIHGFCDASEKGYCAVIYFRIEGVTSIISHLYVSKTKVAPINPVSLPRLELCGAVLLSNLVRKTILSLSYQNYELFLWTDSSIVLGWLEKPPNTWKTYVANRTAQIMQNVGNISWRHVKSIDNPADLGSRGCNSDHLLNSSLWWNGPSWLQKTREEWPKPSITENHSLEIKRKFKTFHLIAVENSKNDTCVTEDLLDRFSKWDKAIRVMTYVFRFLSALTERLKISSSGATGFNSQSHSTPWQDFNHKLNEILPIHGPEFLETKNKLIRLSQILHFKEDYLNLINKRSISKKSSLHSLNPYLDGNGIMRINGRLSNAGLSFNERHPIILAANSTFCKLFINFTHNLLLHAGINLMLRAIRGEYFVPRLKPALRFCVRNCIICVRHKKEVTYQLMGSLPSERSLFSLPFTYTGLDFAGPFSIKTSKLRNAPYHKGYVCVFVCFCTKAIHLELCSDLTTVCFQAAFTRFVGRRGLPKKVMSDNGTNFVGAERAFRSEYEEFLKSCSDAVIEQYATLGFEWSFIPPNAPHMGGLWEAGVKSFKLHFKKVAQNNRYTFEEFTTLLTRIESVLNSRPLSPLSDDPNELLALTPGHFLRGAPLLALPESPKESLTLRDRWEKLKVLHHQFARRWKDEYLKELQRRYKWQNSEENVKIGQLAVLKDDLLPPNEWKLARITKIYPGNDGLVRVADLKTQTGLVTRAIAKICILPIPLAEEHL